MEATEQTAIEKAYAWINEQVAAGRTIYVSTHLRVTKVSPKTVASWEAAGRPMFKLTSTNLYMARGKGYDCLSFGPNILGVGLSVA